MAEDYAAVVACLECGRRANRIGRGLEVDEYQCVIGHVFFIDWSHSGPPTTPQYIPGVFDDEKPAEPEPAPKNKR